MVSYKEKQTEKGKASSKTEKSSKRKADDESDAKAARKAAKLAKRKAEAMDPEPEVEESKLIINPGGQFVFQYLSNKLMRRKAEVAKQRRDAGKWW